MRFTRIGLDTSKSAFQVHAVGVDGRTVVKRKLSRGQLEPFFARLSPTVVGLEACGASHHWARTLERLGHQVRLVPPQYVKPFVKRSKTDAADAEAISEAMDRPGMRAVPVKSEVQQADGMILKVRALLTKQRTMAINALRGHLAEFGIVGAKGGRLEPLLETARARLPEPAVAMLRVLADTVAGLEAQLHALEVQLRRLHRESADSRRLATLPGAGPLIALTALAKVPDPRVFRSGRHFAAWIGLTPKEHSTAGRQRLGKISRAGDPELRSLLVLGATAVVSHARRSGKGDPWLMTLLAKKPPKLVAVALANKMARILWAMMASGEAYRPRPAA